MTQIIARNLWPNPAFLDPAAGRATGYWSAEIEHSFEDGNSSKGCLIVTRDENSGVLRQGGIFFPQIDEVVSAGTPFVARAAVKAPEGSRLTLSYRLETVDGDYLTETGVGAVTFTGSGEWQIVSTDEPLVWDEDVRPGVQVVSVGDSPEGEIFRIDDLLMVCQSEPISGPFWTGSDEGAEWEGLPNRSPSILFEVVVGAARTGPFPGQGDRDGWRFIAQRVLTGEWLDWDLPLTLTSLRWDLSGPGSLRGSVAPDVGTMRDVEGDLILDEWGTLIYAEHSGSIRWGGIVQRCRPKGAVFEVEAAGFSSYPKGIPFLGDIREVDVDPAEIYRRLWDEIQSEENGDLGVTVDDTATPIRVGTAKEPYRLRWSEPKDVGSELVSLAGDGRFDFVEEHSWDGDEIAHRIRIGFPRLGRKRDDLAFRQGDNVVSVVEPEQTGEFANEVFGIGAGEGRKARTTRVPLADGRLRRPFVYTDKGERDEKRLKRLARKELDRHRPALGVEKIEVVEHSNAPIGSWTVGDDVYVEATLPWIGEFRAWHRITAWELTSETRAVLTLAPSDSFTYG